jgi:putative ABC transport system permease protein
VNDWRFVIRMVTREARTARRQLVLYASAISLGVAALVAITSFRTDVTAALHEESRALLGADVELRSRSPFDAAVRDLLDSLRTAGVPVASVTAFSSMAFAPHTGSTRLVEVRAIGGGFPFYGTIATTPAGRWDELGAARQTLVDPAVLVYLGIGPGDTIRLGDAAFRVAGTVDRVPGEIGLEGAIAPRVYIAERFVDDTGLLRFGSLVRYAALLALPDAAAAERLVDEHHDLFEQARVGHDTATEREEELSEWFDVLSRFLGLLGLTALLLGGLATGSAVHVFVRRKLQTVAMLRCVGASQRTLFAIYLLLAALMGLVGAALGVALGAVVQHGLPSVLADFVPLQVAPRFRIAPALAGFALGIWVAVVFALLPLLDVRNVSPLQALRHAVEPPPRRRDRWKVAAHLLILATVVVLSISQAPLPVVGVVFAGAIGFTTLALWATARILTFAARRLLPRRAPYVVRQGVANLFRPHNQTTPVTLAVGFGVFLLGTVLLVQRNLLERLAFESAGDRPNLVVFDIQADQVEGVREILAGASRTRPAITPIVPARIAAIGTRPVEALLQDTSDNVPGRWALRREYRNTYRDTLVASEELVAGAWWDQPDTDAGRLPRISMEQDLAEELQVGAGDRITWDVQGVLVDTEIASLRRVDWARFELNFFVVFEPGVLESAPRTYVALTHVPGGTALATVQRDLVTRYSNVSALDVSTVQATLQRLLESVSLVIRVMALFSIGCGLVVLLGAVATSRWQRLRESILLKTIGARIPQVRSILAVEYVALGLLASLAGTLLAIGGGWGAVTFLFRLEFRLPVASVVMLAGTGVAATALIGILGNRGLVRRPPLAVLRDVAE